MTIAFARYRQMGCLNKNHLETNRFTGENMIEIEDIEKEHLHLLLKVKNTKARNERVIYGQQN